MSKTTSTRYQAVKLGGPFERVEYDVPSPGPTEVVVRNKAVALNPLDWKQLEYGAMVDSWPATFGYDGAGIVEAVGSDVEELKKGDEVFGFYGASDVKSFAFQDYSVINQSFVGVKPKPWSFEEVASLPVAFMTAAASVHVGLGTPLPFLPDSKPDGYKPKTILVLGGSSSVGSCIVEILRLVLPSSNIIATSSAKHHEHVGSLGATTVVDYKAKDVVQQIKQAASSSSSSSSSSDVGEGQGVEAIVDAVNGVAENTSLFDVLTHPTNKFFVEVMTGQNVKSVPDDITHVPISLSLMFKRPGGNRVYASLSKLIQDGLFKLPIPITKVGQGFDAIGQGLLTLKNGVSGTKLVVGL